MPTATTALHARFAQLAAEPGAPTWLRRLRRMLATISDPYRPELHYMRGPGPKWRQKQGLVA